MFVDVSSFETMISNNYLYIDKYEVAESFTKYLLTNLSKTTTSELTQLSTRLLYALNEQMNLDYKAEIIA